jgi:hypothetical protein
VQQAQAPMGQILLAVVGVEEVDTASVGIEHQRDGVHREISAGQIVIQPPRAHPGILRRDGIRLPPGGGHIQQPDLPVRQRQLQLHRAEAAVLTPGAAAAGWQGGRQALHQLDRPPFEDQIQIR